MTTGANQNSDLQIFVPLSKVDEENRLVYGLVAEEVMDNAGEMFDYTSSKPHFEKWSADAETASRGLSKGNLRSMHGKVAAGVLTDLSFNDDDCRIECVAKVVDDNEWNKVLAGVYTGFSMGGRYAKRWVEKSDGGSTKRYTAVPSEVSLVDKPCVPTAIFDFVKADGMTVQVHHGDPLDDEAVEKVDVERHSHRASNGKFCNSPVKDVASHGGTDPSGHGSTEAKALSCNDAAKLFAKADGDTDMSEYNPTNDELSARGMQLAKAAGKPESSWLDFMDEARTQLTSEHLAKADTSGTDSSPGTEGADNPAKKRGDLEEENVADAAGKANATGSANETAQANQHKETAAADPDSHVAKSDGPVQKWETSDGQTFLKKADAIAHEDGLQKGEPSLAEQLALAKTIVTEIETGEAPAPAADDAGDQPEVLKFADFFEAAAKLPEVVVVVEKGMYEVSRFAEVLRSLGSLQLQARTEAAREGDDSAVPGSILDGIETLGAALVAMASEEVAEMTAALRNPTTDQYGHCDTYMALAAPVLGLEKADLITRANDILAKRAPAEGENLEKVDTGTLEKMAKLETEAGELREELAKANGELQELGPLVKGLVDDLNRIKSLPRPAAPVTNVVEKADDGRGTGTPAQETGDPLAKFSPDQLADAAIRMAQQNGRTMTASPR